MSDWAQEAWEGFDLIGRISPGADEKTYFVFMLPKEEGPFKAVPTVVTVPATSEAEAIRKAGVAFPDLRHVSVTPNDPTPKPKLLGLGGLLRSGKDTVADYLVEEVDEDWVKMGMSEPLNDALLALNPWIPSRIFSWLPGLVYVRRYRAIHDKVGYTEAKKLDEVRRLLQALGTEVGRDMVGQNVWVDIAARRIRAHAAEGRSVAMTGIRFPNEIEMIESLGGTTVWVQRGSDVHVDVTATAVTGAHSSENSVGAADFDLVLENDGALEDLYAKTRGLIDGLKGGAA